MKIRSGFVSNSSSTAFIITNKTGYPIDLKYFVEENPQLIKKFREEYDWYKAKDGYNQKCLVKSAADRHDMIGPGDNYRVFGDEQGDLVGAVFDYILRDGGESESFRWRFKEWLR